MNKLSDIDTFGEIFPSEWVPTRNTSEGPLKRLEYNFPNGYGASVIRGPHSYGGKAGLYELAVLLNGDLCYTTSITSDVLGWLTATDVGKLINEIAALPKP